MGAPWWEAETSPPRGGQLQLSVQLFTESGELHFKHSVDIELLVKNLAGWEMIKHHGDERR